MCIRDRATTPEADTVRELEARVAELEAEAEQQRAESNSIEAQLEAMPAGLQEQMRALNQELYAAQIRLLESRAAQGKASAEIRRMQDSEALTAVRTRELEGLEEDWLGSPYSKHELVDEIKRLNTELQTAQLGWIQSVEESSVQTHTPCSEEAVRSAEALMQRIRTLNSELMDAQTKMLAAKRAKPKAASKPPSEVTTPAAAQAPTEAPTEAPAVVPAAVTPPTVEAPLPEAPSTAVDAGCAEAPALETKSQETANTSNAPGIKQQAEKARSAQEATLREARQAQQRATHAKQHHAPPQPRQATAQAKQHHASAQASVERTREEREAAQARVQRTREEQAAAAAAAPVTIVSKEKTTIERIPAISKKIEPPADLGDDPLAELRRRRQCGEITKAQYMLALSYEGASC
eukprot:TRINITY_DN1153_c0_g1_i4.p1 TRINITY_DN1153_c0_g1~~TRINITY_DN1153_c0_g1_i4.p1  ORF type:complete len:408 (-),score=132.38 TRINITY_DN1153_c0_g1_i4:64-1287(-)